MNSGIECSAPVASRAAARTMDDRAQSRTRLFHWMLLLLVGLLTANLCLAQAPHAGTLFLDQKEFKLKSIAEQASSNHGNCGGLDRCRCSRARCHPVSGAPPLQCVPIENQFFRECDRGSCEQSMLVNYNESYVTSPAPGSTKSLSPEVARDICLQRALDSTFQELSVPENYEEFFFGSASGAFRQYPGREQNETQCTSYDPRWRPWYVNAISVAKDVKILVDVAKSMDHPVTIDYNRPPSSTYLDVAKDITLGLMKALSPQDYVEVISFDSVGASSLGGPFSVNSSYNYFHPSGRPELAPLVTDVKDLAASAVPTALSNLNGALLQAASSFNQLKSLKVIVVLSNGLFMVNSTTFPSAALQSSKAKLMVHKLPTNDDGGDTFLLNTSFQKDVCSVKGSFELLDALATLNPLYSMRRYFTYLARIQLSVVGGNVTWSNSYPSVSQNRTSMSPTYAAFGSDGLLIGVAGTDFVVDKLDERLRTLVLQDFSRRSRGTLQAPADVPMTCFYQNATAIGVCPGSTLPGSAAVCPRTDTSSSLAQLTCCRTCGSSDDAKNNGPSNLGLIVGIPIAALAVLLAFVGFVIWRRRTKQKPDSLSGGSSPQFSGSPPRQEPGQSTLPSRKNS